MSEYAAYYASQAADASYDMPYRSQKGGGIGSFFSRRVLPIFKRTAKALGKEAISTSVGFVKDVLSGRDLKESVHDRVKTAGTNLSEMIATNLSDMVGSGRYKGRISKRKPQSRTGTKRRKIKRRVKTRRDRFD